MERSEDKFSRHTPYTPFVNKKLVGTRGGAGGGGGGRQERSGKNKLESAWIVATNMEIKYT